MSKILVGLHYGRSKMSNGKEGPLWLELRPFNWIIKDDILKSQRTKHYFKSEWFAPGNLATVVDHPQRDAVYIVGIATGYMADRIIKALHNKGYAVKPVLRFKNPNARHYAPKMYRLSRMLRFAKLYSKKRKPGQNRVVYVNLDKKHRYIFGK